MEKKSLPTLAPSAEALGRDTIMNRALAMRHGVPYVHLVVLAIDLDRIREAVEDGNDSDVPFGWEIFLTEKIMLDSLSPIEESDRVLIEDVCLSIFDLGPGAAPLGSQVPFAVYDAIERGRWPRELAPIFHGWKKKPKDMCRALDPLFAREKEAAAELAAACLELPLDPPLAEPTADQLEALLEDT